MLAADHVAVRLGRQDVLHGIDFAAAPGQVTAIAGPNGAGKSTLLKVLSGEVRPSRGAVRLDGRALADYSPAELASRRAVLPQSSRLAFPFTVREVVRLGLTAGAPGIAGAERAALPDAALARVDLAGFAGRHFQELSGGERQRVHLARVLCQVWRAALDGVPRYLLLDEPTASLDIKHQMMILEIARGFAECGGGVIAILHDLNQVARFADRVALMDRGRIAAFGPPGDVLGDAVVSEVFGIAVRAETASDGRRLFLPEDAGRRLSAPAGADVSCRSRRGASPGPAGRGTGGGSPRSGSPRPGP